MKLRYLLLLIGVSVATNAYALHPDSGMSNNDMDCRDTYGYETTCNNDYNYNVRINPVDITAGRGGDGGDGGSIRIEGSYESQNSIIVISNTNGGSAGVAGDQPSGSHIPHGAALNGNVGLIGTMDANLIEVPTSDTDPSSDDTNEEYTIAWPEKLTLEDVKLMHKEYKKENDKNVMDLAFYGFAAGSIRYDGDKFIISGESIGKALNLNVISSSKQIKIKFELGSKIDFDEIKNDVDSYDGDIYLSFGNKEYSYDTTRETYYDDDYDTGHVTKYIGLQDIKLKSKEASLFLSISSREELIDFIELGFYKSMNEIEINIFVDTNGYDVELLDQGESFNSFTWLDLRSHMRKDVSKVSIYEGEGYAEFTATSMAVLSDNYKETILVRDIKDLQKIYELAKASGKKSVFVSVKNIDPKYLEYLGDSTFTIDGSIGKNGLKEIMSSYLVQDGKILKFKNAAGNLEQITQAGRFYSIDELDFSHNELEDEDVRYIIKFISENLYRNLDRIILSHNYISIDGARDIFDMYESSNNQFEKIDFSYNYINEASLGDMIHDRANHEDDERELAAIAFPQKEGSTYYDDNYSISYNDYYDHYDY